MYVQAMHMFIYTHVHECTHMSASYTLHAQGVYTPIHRCMCVHVFTCNIPHHSHVYMSVHTCIMHTYEFVRSVEPLLHAVWGFCEDGDTWR